MRESGKQVWENFWSRKSDIREVYSNTDRIRRNLSKHLQLDKARILEVGAGTGRDSFFMADDGAELFLLDYSKNSLKIIAKESPVDRTVCPVGADAFQLPFLDDTFDAVFHQGLLEHFRREKASALLKENIRVLKPGGFLVVDVPQRWHVYTIVKHILIALNAWFAGWEREFSIRELRSFLQDLDMIYRDAYGEWMYPSFFYRSIREIGGKIGLNLPLYPNLFNPVSQFRKRFRSKLEGSSFQLYTALSIGVIAVKPGEYRKA